MFRCIYFPILKSPLFVPGSFHGPGFGFCPTSFSIVILLAQESPRGRGPSGFHAAVELGMTKSTESQACGVDTTRGSPHLAEAAHVYGTVKDFIKTRLPFHDRI